MSLLFINLAIWKLKPVKELIPHIMEEPFLLTPDDSFLWRDQNHYNTWPLLLDSLVPEVWTSPKNKPGRGNLATYVFFLGVCCDPCTFRLSVRPLLLRAGSCPCPVLWKTQIQITWVNLMRWCAPLHLPLFCFISNYSKPKWEEGCYVRALQKPKHQTLFT